MSRFHYSCYFIRSALHLWKDFDSDLTPMPAISHTSFICNNTLENKSGPVSPVKYISTMQHVVSSKRKGREKGKSLDLKDVLNAHSSRLTILTINLLRGRRAERRPIVWMWCRCLASSITPSNINTGPRTTPGSKRVKSEKSQWAGLASRRRHGS